MEKKSIYVKGCVLIIVFLLAGAIQIIPAAENQTYETVIHLTINSENEQKIDLNIGTYDFQRQTTLNGEYTSITFQDSTGSGNIGDANLPVLRKLIEIPYHAQPRIVINKISWKTVSLQENNLPDQIIPVQHPIPKTISADQVTTFDKNTDFYTQNQFVPEEVVRIIETGEIRGRCFVQLEISPVHYNPSSGGLKILTALDFTIELLGSDYSKTSENQQRYSNQIYTPMFESLFLNDDQNTPFQAGMDNNIGYLIIVHDSFYDQILPFAAWKQNLGFEVTTTRTSEIPGSGTLLQKIEAYIENAYNNWAIPPTFILLVGDTGYVPTYTTGLESGVSCTDLFYSTISTGDYYPDVFIGRFPAASTTQVAAMVQKTLCYEQRAYPSPDFLTHACFMAGNDNYQITEGTHNYCISHYLASNSWLSDRLYEVTYGATTQSIRNAINNGRILAVYSGHGGETSWADGPAFSQSDVNGLTNLGEYPFVFSHACVTGTFTVSECFGETWLRAANKAGIFFYGASASSYWTEDDWLQKNWFRAWWDDDLETIAAMTTQGMIYTVAQIGGPGVSTSRYYFQMYNILGDPSLTLKQNPTPENDVGVKQINTPSEIISVGSQTIGVTIENYGLLDQTAVPVTCQIYSFGALPYEKDFETNDGNYVPGGITDLWACGLPTVGPTTAHSGTNCFGTNLNGQYPANSNALLDSPLVQLPNGFTLSLSFWQWFNTEGGYDGGNVKISTDGGNTWNVLGAYEDPYNTEAAEPQNSAIPGEPCFSGHGYRYWDLVTFDLSGYAGEEIMLRWQFGSDVSNHYEGWYIDDIAINIVSLVGGDGAVYSGTTTVDVTAESTTSVQLQPTWIAEPGTYGMLVRTGLISDEQPDNDQKIRYITVIDNHPPLIPTFTARKTGTVGETYLFNSMTTDPENNQVYYLWDWGDGTTSDWLGPYNSGEQVTTSHSWSRSGRFNIKVKSKDVYDAESDWSNVKRISIMYLEHL